MRIGSGKLLALDTSGGVCSVACGDGGVVVAERSLTTQSSHFEVLDSLVAEVLHAAQCGLGDLQGIVVGAGPGSFTGLRIGYGYAKGVCAGLNLPMAAVSSFAAAAYEAAPDGSGSGVTAVVGPARRDHYFLGIFGSQGGWRPPIEDLSLELLAARVTGQAARIVTIGEPPEPISKVFPGVISQVRIAVGILGLVEKLGAEWSRGPEELSRLAPEYGQKVAAKTIAERSGG